MFRILANNKQFIILSNKNNNRRTKLVSVHYNKYNTNTPQCTRVKADRGNMNKATAMVRECGKNGGPTVAKEDIYTEDHKNMRYARSKRCGEKRDAGNKRGLLDMTVLRAVKQTNLLKFKQFYVKPNSFYKTTFVYIFSALLLLDFMYKFNTNVLKRI